MWICTIMYLLFPSLLQVAQECGTILHAGNLQVWVKLSLSSVLHCSDLSSLKTVKYFLHVLCLCVASMTIKSDLTAQFKGKTKTLQWPRVG